MSHDGVNLFAGPGGTCEGARQAGLSLLGIEWDEAACATREAAGHPTLRADVTALEPRDFAPCKTMAGSPPCPTFSAAGKGGGRHLTDVLVRAMGELAAGSDTRAERREEAYEILEPVYWTAEQADAKKKRREPDRDKSRARARRDADMSLLVVEPLRWALALKPSRIMCEQVPDVLGLWTVMAQVLQTQGYRTWAGVLSSERYGVPQTRKRAILLASLDGAVHPPQPTHQAYVPGEPAWEQHTLEGTLAPWVSMAEALGWGMTERPSLTITAKPSERGGHREMGGGSGSRRTTTAERRRGAWIVDTGNTRSGQRTEGRWRSSAAPAPVITSRADQLEWRPERLRNNAQANAAERGVDEPAPTITAAHDAGERVWVYERPATTIAGDPRVHPPGHKENSADPPNTYEQRRGENAVRVTVEQAAILQAFPLDYPWQGTLGAQFTQVGNAVPPPLARSCFEALAGEQDARAAA